MHKNSYYITTPIYYVTAKPHLGSLYSTLIADVFARWHILKGQSTFFLTGTDEHGQKIAQAAQKAGKGPQDFVDGFIPDYKRIWNAYGIDYNFFMRTTDAYHKHAVQVWVQRLLDQGDIYKATYTGWYCTPCETFVSEDVSLLQGPPCTSCGRETHRVSEESYFFKLSAYQEKLLNFYREHPDFIVPKERLNEVIAFVKGGLKDLSISRTTISWGISFPQDPAHVVYVWVDALTNYISAIGYGDSARQAEFEQWWPAQCQVLGKDIVRFHAVYWPAMLMAIGLALPKHLLVHGWIKMGDQKMSKSLGNAVDPEVLCERYGADAVRYYLMRAIVITHDSPFTIEDLERHVTADLANDLGNLLNRTVALAHKNDIYEINYKGTWSESAMALRELAWNLVSDFGNSMDEYYVHNALSTSARFIHHVNSFFHEHEPWKLTKTNPEKFKEVIAATCHGLYAIGILLWPVMPTKMTELLKRLGCELTLGSNVVEQLENDTWQRTYMLHAGPPLFVRPEPLAIETNSQGGIDASPEAQKSSASLGAAQETAPGTAPEGCLEIGIDDVLKVWLVVGHVTDVQDVEKSDKLLKMSVDFGPYGQRQILGGVKQHVPKSDLMGKKVVYVFNLAPRKMVGLTSQGMMMTVRDGAGTLKPVFVGDSIPAGTRLS